MKPARTYNISIHQLLMFCAESLYVCMIERQVSSFPAKSLFSLKAGIRPIAPDFR